MTDIPDTFINQDHYDEWLDELAENEVDEFLDAPRGPEYTGSPYHIDSIRSFVLESPQVAQADWQWVHIYRDVIEYGYNPIPEMEILIPAEDPIRKIATAARTGVITDLVYRTAVRLEDHGYGVER